MMSLQEGDGHNKNKNYIDEGALDCSPWVSTHSVCHSLLMKLSFIGLFTASLTSDDAQEPSTGRRHSSACIWFLWPWTASDEMWLIWRTSMEDRVNCERVLMRRRGGWVYLKGLLFISQTGTVINTHSADAQHHAINTLSPVSWHAKWDRIFNLNIDHGCIFYSQGHFTSHEQFIYHLLSSVSVSDEDSPLSLFSPSLSLGYLSMQN